MAYIVRVELDNASVADFPVLHEAMARKGFLQTIVGDSGKKYQLPRATYRTASTATRSEIHELVKSAVRETGRTAEILVVGPASSEWSGLQFAK